MKNLDQIIADLENTEEKLRAAIHDALPGLSSIDDGQYNEWTGQLTLNEDQWGVIAASTAELKKALE